MSMKNANERMQTSAGLMRKESRPAAPRAAPQERSASRPAPARGRRILAAVFGLLAVMPMAAYAASIAAWDFTTAGGTGSGSVSWTAEVFNASMDSTATITRGSGASASAGTNSFRTTGFQNNGVSTANTDYFQVTLSASSGYTLSIGSITGRFSGTATFYTNNLDAGVTNQWAWSTNGSTFTMVGSPSTVTKNSLTNGIDFSGVAALQNVTDEKTVTLRYFASGQTTTGGWGPNSPANDAYGLDIHGTLASACTPDKLTITQNTNQYDAISITGSGAPYDSGATMGMWANGDAAFVAAWKTTRVTSATSGGLRKLQIGDEFTICVNTYGVFYGQLGVALNRGGATGSWANRTNGFQALVQQDGGNFSGTYQIGSWYAKDSGSESFTNTPAGSSAADYTIKFKITSSSSYNVDLNGVTKFDRTFANSPGTNDRVDAFSVYLSDDRRYQWDWGDNRRDSIWKQTTTITNLGVVEFGGDGGSRTVAGWITDGNNAVCTNTASPNRLIKSGSGTLTLGNVYNTYSLDTVVSNGTLQIGADGTLGTAPGSVSNAHLKLAAGAAIVFTNGFTLNSNRGITLIGNNPYIAVATGKVVAYNGIITDGANTYGLIKNQDGELVLGGANTYDGGTYLDKGVLTISNASALGTAKLDLGKGFGSTADIATLKLAGANTVANSITVKTNAYGVKMIQAVETATLSGPVTNQEIVDDRFTIDVASTKTLTMSGVFTSSGGGKIKKTGAGTLLMSNTANTHDQKVQLDNGVLSLSASRNLGTEPGGSYSNKIIFNGGTLLANATFTLHTNYATTVSNGNGTINVAASQTLTYPAIISGAGMLTKIGNGVLKLNGPNLFTNALVISTGVVQVGDASTAGSLAALTITNSAMLRWNRSDASTYAGIISGAGSMTNASGTLTLSGHSPLTGGTVVTGASTLIVSGSLSNSPVTLTTNCFLKSATRVGNLAVTGGTVDPTNATTTCTNLTVGTLTLNAGAKMRVDLSNVSGAAGKEWDLITATGAISRAGAFAIDLYGTPTGFNNQSVYTWKIMAGGAAMTGSGAGTVNTNGTFGSAGGGGAFTITNSTTDVWLTFTPRTPADPTAFTATAVGINSNSLAYTVNGFTDPVVIVANTTGTFGTPSGAVPAPGNSFASGTVVSTNTTTPAVHTGLNCNQIYYYKAWSYNGTVFSTPGVTANATTLRVSAPASPYANPTNATDFTANWSAVANATGYRIDVATDSGFSSFVSGYNDRSVGGVGVLVTGLVQTTTYYFRTRTEATGCTSLNSTTVTVVTAAGTPWVALADSGTQVAAGNVAAASTNNTIYKFQLTVTNSGATLTDISFTTAGSHAASDIANYKVYYSANNVLELGTDTLLGTISTGLGTGAHTLSSLLQGLTVNTTNHFFITVDLSSTAEATKTINVQALTTSDLAYSSANETGSTTAGGAQTITAALAIDNTGTPVAGNVAAGTSDAVLSGFRLSITGTVSFTALTLTTSGSATSSDLSNFRVIYDVNNNGTYESGTDVVASSTNAIGGTIAFTMYGQTAISGVRRYLVIANAAAAATAGRTFTGGIAAASDVTTTGTESGTAAGNQQTLTGTATIDNTGMPTAGNKAVNTANAVLSGFRITPSGTIDFTALTLTTSGTATSSDLSNFRVVLDVNNNGTYEGGTDTIASSTNALGGTIAFTMYGQTGFSAARRYLVIADVAAAGTAGATFTGGIAAAGDVTTTGTESGSAAGTQQTITGTVAIDNTGTPVAGTVAGGTADAVLSGFRLTPTGTISFTSVKLTITGTATSSDLTSFRVAYDVNNNGTYEGGTDTIASDTNTIGSSITFTMYSQSFSAARRYLVIANAEATATDGRTFTGSVTNAVDVGTTATESGSATGNQQTLSVSCVPGELVLVQQTNYYGAIFNDYGGTYNNGGTEVGQWAHDDNTGLPRQTVAWRSFQTSGTTGGNARELQPGDRFRISVYGWSPYGILGCSLNDGASTGSWANRHSNTRGYIQCGNANGDLYVTYSNNLTASWSGVKPWNTTVTFQFDILSSREFSANIVGQTPKYDLYMLNNPSDTDRIDGFSIYYNDDYADGGRKDAYWKQDTTITNLGYVELGGSDGSPTIYGKITDGTNPKCTNASPNFLRKIGTGTVTLANTNTYTYYTHITNGTLNVPYDAALGTAPGSISNAHIRMDAGSALVGTESFTLNSNRGITLTGGNVYLAVAAGKTMAYNGVITDGAGTYGFVKNQSGELVLGGTNTYDGGTYLDNGTLTVSNAAALGTAKLDLGKGAGTGTETATLKLALAGMTFTNAIVVKTNSTGVKTIQAVVDAAISGGITNDEAGDDRFNIDVASAKTLTISGLMSGASGGELTKLGAGTLVLSNAGNSHTKKVTVQEGVLSISASRNLGEDPGGSYANKLTLNGGTLKVTASFALNTNYNTVIGASHGAIDVDAGVVLTNGAPISGTGALNKLGNGTLLLVGDSTFSGPFTNSAGTLQIGNNGTAGTLTANLVNNAALFWHRSDNVTYTGTIGGTGSLVKNGAGMLTLSGHSAMSGATTISNGILYLTGSLSNSAVTVISGTTLRGSSKVGNLTVSGTVDPTNAAAASTNLACGTLTLNAGGAMRVDLSAAAGTAGKEWDLVSATGAITANASGTFTINVYGTPTGFDNATGYSWKIMAGTSVASFDAGRFTVATNGTFGAAGDGGTFSVANVGNDIHLVFSPRTPAMPGSFWISVTNTTSLELSFTKNAQNDDVVIVYNGTGTFSTPTGTASAVGGSFAGGIVVYKGGTSPQTHGSLYACSNYFYKAWSMKGTNYSATGLTDNDTTLGPAAPTGPYTSPTNDVNFTANWSASAGATGYRIDVSMVSNFTGSAGGITTNGIQDFETSPATPTATYSASGGELKTGSSGSGDRPASSAFYVSGSRGYSVSNSTATLTFDALDTSSLSSPQLTLRVAAFSMNSTGNGMDGSDYVGIEISPDNGANYYSTVRVLGNNNAYWAYSATGNALTGYDGNASPVDFAPGGGGSRTTDGYSTITITNLPTAAQMRVRVTLYNDAANERWAIDDLVVSGSNTATSAYVSGYSNRAVAAVNVSVTGLTSGATYYWRVRAEGANGCSSLNSSTVTVTTILTPAIALTNNGTQVAAANVQEGTTNLVLHKFQLAVTSTNATLTNLTFTTAGSYQAADITNLIVWRSADATWDGADTRVHTFESTLGPGTFATAALSLTLTNSTTNFFFITADIATNPTYGRTINVNAVTTNDVLFQLGNKSGATAAGGAQTIIPREPTVHATGLWFTSVGMNQMTVNWTNGNGARRIVVVHEATAVSWTPTDNVAPSGVNADFSSASDQGSGNKIGYDGTGSTFTLSGLNPNTTYYVKIFEYNGSGAYVNYYTGGSPLTGSQATICAAAPTGVFASFTNYTAFTSTWSAVSGASGYFLDVSTNSTYGGLGNQTLIDEDFVSFTDWTDNGTAEDTGSTHYGAASPCRALGIGDSLISPAVNNPTQLVFFADASNAGAVTNEYSTNGTTWIAISTFTVTTAGATLTNNLLTSPNLSGFTNVQFRFSSGHNTFYLDDVRVTGGGVPDYVPGYSNRTVAGTSQAVTGLTEGVTYYFRVRADASGYCASANSTNGTVTTLIDFAPQPTVQASNLVFTSVTRTSMSVNWNNGNGTNRIVLAHEGAAVDSHPVDGVTYTASAVFGSGQQIGTGNYVIFNGTGSGPVSVTGLKTNVNYHFRVYEYNGTNATVNYLTTTAVGNPSNQVTLDLEPGIGNLPATLTATTTVGSNPSSGAFTVTNVGGSALSYDVLTNAAWLSVSPSTVAGKTNLQTQSHTVSYNVSGMTAGVYTATITVTNTGTGNNIATNSPQTISVILTNNAIPDPTAVTATEDGKTLVRLGWTTNATYNTVLLVYKSGSAPTAPTQGTTYTNGGACGGGTVIYKGMATNLEHVVVSSTTNNYVLYSVNNNHYSAGVATSVTTTAFASFEIVETFSYTNSTALTGWNGEKGWGGAWFGDTGLFTNSPGSFSTQTNYPAPTGNKLWTRPANDANLAIYRPLGQNYNSGRIYFGYIMNYEYSGGSKYEGLSLMWSNSSEKLFIGEIGAQDQQLGIDSTGSSRTLSAGSGNDYIIIGYYDWAAGEAKASAYKIGSTNVPLDEPTSWDVTVSKSSNTVGWVNCIRLAAGEYDGGYSGTPGNVYFDEVRIATNWNDLLVVVPVKPDDPTNQVTTADGSEMVRLSWTKNGAGSDVMILHNTVAITTDPTDGSPYSAGGTIGAATVIYKGSATALEHVVTPGTTNYYKFYSVKTSGNLYSTGVTASAVNAAYASFEKVNPFSYTNGTAFGTTLKGGQGFGNNYWVANSGSWAAKTNTNSALGYDPKFVNLSGYPDMAGNLGWVENPGDGASATADRDISPSISTGTIYVSFMLAYQYYGSNKWAGLSLMNGTTEKAFFGKGSGANWSTLAAGGDGSTYWSAFDLAPTDGGSGSTGNVYLIVGKYDFGTKQIQVKAWNQLTGTFPGTEPTSWDATGTLGTGIDQITRIRLNVGAANGSIGRVFFDEIRYATNWAGLIAVQCPTWAGSNFFKNVAWTSPGTSWLGDSESFMFQSYPVGLGQSAGIEFDWAQNGAFATYKDLTWLQSANNNSYWSNKLQMTSAGVITSRYVASGTSCTAVRTNNPALTVSNLNAPTNVSATRDAVNTNSAIDLAWTRGVSGSAKDTLIVRQTVDSGWSTPVNGATYNAGDSLGGGTVVYRGAGTSFEDAGLAPDTTNYYRFYAENWTYYSVAYATANATTAPGGQNIVIDGNFADWIGTPADAWNSAASSRQEFIWNDKRGEQRPESADKSNGDLREFRVYADNTWVYFLVRMTNITDSTKPFVAIGIDTRTNSGSSSMNWLGDDAGTYMGSDYFGGGAAVHYPEYQLNVHHVSADGGLRIEMYAQDGSYWSAPASGNTNVADGTTYESIEFKVARANLNLAGTKTARFTVASYINTGAWNNDGDGTLQLLEGTADAIDSIAIAPYNTEDNSATLSAWLEDIADNDLDFWFDVKFSGTGLSDNQRPSTPVLVSPTNNQGGVANPVLRWQKSTDADGEITGYLLEISTNEQFNGTTGTENGVVDLRVNLDANTTNYTVSSIMTQYWWRVRARDTAGQLSSATTHLYRVSGKADIEGPQPTLVYIGTNVAGFLAGDYTNHIARYGYITNVTDREIRDTNNVFGFVLRWDDPSGVYATNKMKAADSPPNGAGGFAFNIVSTDGRVSPNWDILEFTGGTQTKDWGKDQVFYATNTITTSGNNNDPVITNYVVAAFTMTNYDENVEYYLTVSAEDACTEGGSWSSYGSWNSFVSSSSALPYYSGWCNDGPNTARNITTNYLIRINVTDDDRTPPSSATGQVWSSSRSLHLSSGSSNHVFTGSGLNVNYTLYDGWLSTNPLLMRFNVWDPYYRGLAYGAAATQTDQGRILTNTSLSVANWLTNNVDKFSSGNSIITDEGRNDDSYLGWYWTSLGYDDLSALWGANDIYGEFGETNLVSLDLFDRDNDREGDQSEQTVNFGWMTVRDDDAVDPEIVELTVDGVGGSGISNLYAGAIAIIGVNGGPSSSAERFSFVVLAPFPAGTAFYFNDTGWDTNANTWYRQTEWHTNYWVFSSKGEVGQVFELSLQDLNANGDQVAIYQYTGSQNPSNDSANCRFIYAINMDGEGDGWDQTPLPDNNRVSTLYRGLTNGQNAVCITNAGSVNTWYAGPTNGTASYLLQQISSATNWVIGAAATDYNITNYSFNVTGAGSFPWTVPDLSDHQMRWGGYYVTNIARDVESGLLASNTAFGHAPYYVMYNTNDEVAVSNVFPTTWANGNTAEFVTNVTTGVTGIYDRITLGVVDFVVGVSDSDNDRAGDTRFGTNSVSVNIYDDDAVEPAVSLTNIVGSGSREYVTNNGEIAYYDFGSGAETNLQPTRSAAAISIDNVTAVGDVPGTGAGYSSGSGGYGITANGWNTSTC